MSLILPSIGAFGHTAAGGGTLSYVSSGIAVNSTITIPAGNSGDIVIAAGTRHSSGTASTSATDYTHIDYASSGNSEVSAFYRVYDGTSHSFTCTGAEGVVYSIYRPSGGTASVGAGVAQGGSSLAVPLSALTLDNTNGSSWIVGIWNLKVGNLADDYTDLINRQNQLFTSVRYFGVEDSNGGLSSWAEHTADGNSADEWSTCAIEVKVT